MITNVIETAYKEAYILNQFIGNNCAEFRYGLPDSCFFKLALGRDCLELYLWVVAIKTVLTQ